MPARRTHKDCYRFLHQRQSQCPGWSFVGRSEILRSRDVLTSVHQWIRLRRPQRWCLSWLHHRNGGSWKTQSTGAASRRWQRCFYTDKSTNRARNLSGLPELSGRQSITQCHITSPSPAAIPPLGRISLSPRAPEHPRRDASAVLPAVPPGAPPPSFKASPPGYTTSSSSSSKLVVHLQPQECWTRELCNEFGFVVLEYCAPCVF